MAKEKRINIQESLIKKALELKVQKAISMLHEKIANKKGEEHEREKDKEKKE